MTVKNIIFDLGGVIINLDYNRTAEAFKRLGLTEFDIIYSQKKQESVFDEFEKGTLDAARFRDIIRQYIPQPVSDMQVDTAWNAMLLDVPDDKMLLLKELNKEYRIFLLSNTNIIHVNAFTKIVESAYGKNAFEAIFERVYYSCLMNMRKPDAEIFQKVINENNLSIYETVFIDDSKQHVAGAKAIGLTGFLLDEKQSLQELVKQIL